MATADFYSALFLFLGGFAGNLMLFVTGRYLFNHQKTGAITDRLEVLKQRFATRKRLSWVMMFVGCLWLLQLVLEQKDTFDHLFG